MHQIWNDLTPLEKKVCFQLNIACQCEFALAGCLEYGFEDHFKQRRQASRIIVAQQYKALIDTSSTYWGLFGCAVIFCSIGLFLALKPDLAFLVMAVTMLLALLFGSVVSKISTLPHEQKMVKLAQKFWPELLDLAEMKIPKTTAFSSTLQKPQEENTWDQKLRSLAARWATPNELKKYLPPDDSLAWINACGLHAALESSIHSSISKSEHPQKEMKRKVL